jgi:hypothetical protein
VTALNPVQRFCGPLVDHAHRGQPASPLNSDQTPTATATPHRASHVDGRVVDRLIDRFGAQPPARLAGESDSQLVGDLLRAPALLQQPGDRLTQLRVLGDPSRPRPNGAGAGGVLGMMRAIPTTAVAVALDLPADRRRGAPELRGDRSDRPAAPFSRSAITTRSCSER